MHKDLKGPVARAVRLGWHLEKGRKHYKLSRDGKLVVIGVTLSDHRAIHNILHEMRRKGAA